MVLDNGFVETVEQLFVGRKTICVVGVVSGMTLSNYIKYDGYQIAKHFIPVNALRLRDRSQQFNSMAQALVLQVGKRGNRLSAIAGRIAGIGIGVLKAVMKLFGYGDPCGAIIG
jgi:hypothetical protein